MHQIIKCSLLLIGSIISMRAFAQTVQENTGWFAWFNSYKLSKHWSFYFDGQIRSADNWNNIRNIIFRPGITYVINAKNSVTAGYAFVPTYTRLAAPSKSTLIENRIWEQYIYSTKFGQVSLQNRFRLEQRFIERQTENVFGQRLRYFVRTIIPLKKQTNTFDKGLFVAIQNEIFFNVQNKEKFNNSFFDQNRAYGALGYRIAPKIDVESGYMNQYIKGTTTNTSNNIIQLAVYTRF